MDVLVLAPTDQQKVLQSRIDSNSDRFDEVWDEVYVVSPLANNEHQALSGRLNNVFSNVLEATRSGQVFPGVNVSDRELEWEHNYRCPDVAVFLNDTKAKNLETHWLGGPDFLVEVVSRHDKSREKLDFYAKVGSREVLVVDRYPWSLELYRLVDGQMALIGRSTVGDPTFLASEVLPLSFRLVEGESRPSIEIVHADKLQRWSV